MTKQLAEHIFNLVKHGHDVAVKHIKGDYMVFMVFKGVLPDETLYGTCGYKTIEECKRGSILSTNWSIKDLQEYFTNEYEIVTEPPIPYEEGDLVDILPIAKELPDFNSWVEQKKEMVEQKGLEIRYSYFSDGGYDVYTKDKSESWLFPHWCLAPHFQEDDKMEEAMELLKKNGYKIIKENNE